MASKLSTVDTSDSSLNFSTDQQESPTEDPLSSQHPIWGSRIKCLQAYMILVLNFSTILHYSYSLGTYGSAIFIPYIIFKVVIGIPITITEIVLGRYVTGNFLRIFYMCSLAKGMLANTFIITFTIIILKFCTMLYLVRYTASIFHGHLEWERCEKSWAKPNCYSLTGDSIAYVNCLKNHSYTYCNNINWETSGSLFWKYEVNNHKSLNSLIGSTSSLIILISIVLIVNFKGIRSVEKIFTIFLWLPLGMSLLITIVVFLIPGAFHGLRNILAIKLSSLKDLKMWEKALEDTLMAFNNGLFALPSVSSHGRFIDDIIYDTFAVVFADIIAIFMLTLPILSIVEMVNFNVPQFKDNTETFIWVSEAFVFFPDPNFVWAFVFYFSMILFELGGQAILYLSVVDALKEWSKNHINMFYISFMMGMLMFALAFLITCTQYVFNYSPGIFLLINTFLYFITIYFFYGFRRFNDNFHFMMGYQPSFFFCCLEILACGLTFLFILVNIYLEKQQSPPLPLKIQFYINFCTPFAIYFSAILFEIIVGYKKGVLRKIFFKNPDWGPSIPLLKKSRIVFNSKTVTKEFMYRQELYKKSFMKPNDFQNQNIVHIN